MDVRDCRTVRLPSSISRRFAERRPGSIGHITLRGKCAGARSAGKPHAACDVAGAGNGLTVRLVRHSHRKQGETDRPRLRSTAPALDPTVVNEVLSRFTLNALRAFFSATPAGSSAGCQEIRLKLNLTGRLGCAADEPSERDGGGHRDRPRRAEPGSVLGDGREIGLVEQVVRHDRELRRPK